MLKVAGVHDHAAVARSPGSYSLETGAPVDTPQRRRHWRIYETDRKLLGEKGRP